MNTATKDKGSFYILDENIVWDSGKRGVNWTPSCDEDAEGFFIEDGVWYISKGWCWDGATSAPDGPQDPNKEGYPLIWLATLIHDLGIYFLKEEDFPYLRVKIDIYFYMLMIDAGYKFSLVYFLGVRLFGRIFGSIKDKVSPNKIRQDHDPIFIGENSSFSEELS